MSNWILTRRWMALSLSLALALSFTPMVWAGGTPDPGTSPLVEDGGDADALPDNENQLLGTLSPDRGLFAGDYVLSDTGLLGSLGTVTYDYYIEVPPTLSAGTLTVEIFDADLGAGEVAGTEEHDQDNGDGLWEATTTYELFDPSGASFASITLPGQDCDPVTVGLQTACNNAWSDLATFSVASPMPGHWRMAIGSPNTGNTNEDDNNSFGIRAHDGDASAGGSEINIYADTYVGIGQVYAADFGSDPGFSRTHDFFPQVTGFCSLSANDFDLDFSGDESLTWLTRTGASPTFTPTFSANAVWAENSVDGFATAADASDYGLWSQRWIIGIFNFVTYWVGDPTADNPTDGSSTPGMGAPDEQPEAGAVRLYLPADGSRFFGQRGGADDAVVAPAKPWVGQTWALLPGETPLTVGVISRARVTITVANPTAFPIQFDTATGGTNVAVATVPTNGGQTTYVTGSASITGGSSTATSVSGAGPWTLNFAPGVIAAGTTATLTYDIDILPSTLGMLDITGGPPPDVPAPSGGTTATFLDETCADAAGGSTVCAMTAQTRATTTFGPLCRLTADVNLVGVPALTVTKTAGTVSNSLGNPGQFEVPFTVTLENTGTTDLVDVQVVDDLTTTFPAPATFTVIAGPTASGTLSANGGYDGNAVTDLLVAASSTLPIGETETIGFTVRFDPNGLAGPFTNTATGTAEDPLGNPVTDDGTAMVGVPEAPAIDIAKTAGAVMDIGGGQFQTTFSLVVTNTGNVDLDTVQVTDDLAAAFPAPVNLVSGMASCTAGSCGTITLDYSGSPDTTLLDDTASSLAPSATFTLELTVVFEPNGEVGPFTNSATASGVSPGGTGVNDTDTADVSIVENPAIDIVKTAGALTSPSLGTYQVVFSLAVTNTGDVDLDMVQVTDDLAATFPAPATVDSTMLVCSAGSCGTITLDYTGPPDTTLLDDTASSLATGATFTLDLTVVFTPNGMVGPYTNSATASGDSPGGTTVDDTDTAIVPIAENPSIAVTKTVDGAVVDNMDGTFTVPYLVSVTNTGDVELTDVQVVDDLTATFPAPSSVVSVTVPVATGTLTANAGFNGAGDTNLLTAASSTLPVAAAETISFSVTFDPGGVGGPFTNTAIGRGTSPGGTVVNDIGTTDISVIIGTPLIGVAKSTTGEAINNGDGTYTVSILIIVANQGDLDLFDVQVTDDLAATFPPPSSVVSVTMPTAMVTGGVGVLTANAAYDGIGDINLLDAASSTLDVGAVGEIMFDITFDPGSLTEFENQAVATGDSANGTTTDISDDGTDPDPDGEDPTPITIEPPLAIEIPTLGQWGLISLALLLAAAARRRLRQ